MTVTICLEGQDGVGKTTQANLLAMYLRGKGLSVEYMKCCGYTPLGKDLRGLILHPEEGKEVKGYAALGLFLADMADMYERGVIPLLGKVDVIILDRFWYSSWCYQSAEGVDRKLLLDLFKRALPLKVDLKVLLDLPPEVSMERCKERGNMDAIESRGADYHTQVYEAYQDLVTVEGFERVKVNSVHETHLTLIEKVNSLL